MFIKRLKQVLTMLLAASVLCACACNKNNDQTPAVTDIIDDEEPTAEPTATPVPRNVIDDTPIARSMVYANELANKVQGYYPTSVRDVYVLENTTMRLRHKLAGDDQTRGLETFSDLKGNVYFTDSMDMYVIDTSGREWTDRYALGSGRVNTTRLGFYYYETHVRDLGVGLPGTDGNYDQVTEIADFSQKWEAHDGKVSVDAKNNKAVFTVDATYDPYVVHRGFSVPTVNVNALEITMAVKGVSSSVEMFINDGPGYRQQQALKFSVNPDGLFHTYIIDISAIQSGSALQGVRLDIGDAVGDEVTITSMRALKVSSNAPKIKVEKTYHTFSDKLHQQFRIIALDKVENIGEYGMVWKIDKSTVSALQIKDGNGTHNDLNIDSESVEYVAFDVNGAGVCGLIIPNDDTVSGSVTVAEENGQYIVRQKYPGKLDLKKGGEATVANRLYNDSTHSFEGIDREAGLERDPLPEDRITVTETNSRTKYTKYDAVRGLYVFTLNGSTFNEAYKKANRNKYFSANVNIKNDSEARKIYLDFTTSGECLECGAMLDANGTLVPLPMEVCKNFTYEKEEKVYDPTDVPYSDTFFPLSLAPDEDLSFTQMHLYQNWGIYPLKQIGSIQFHVSYYHLSTGVTESNCIAPYYVYGRDGWTLPDFRGPSGIMWSDQPQFTAGGHNKFVSYIDGDGSLVRAEYTRSNILSYGPVYADLEYSYKADSGAYEYTLRHMEFPQTDENRTYYTLNLKFLKDLTIDDVRNKFTLHYFDSRDQKFDKLSYTADDGTVKTVVTDFSKANTNTVKLSKDSFWFALYGSNSKDPMNEAFVLKKYDVKLGGKAYEGNFVLRNGYDGVMYNVTELSLDLGKYTFKKGDTIELQFMLVPWGNRNHDTYENIERIYEDSVKKPLKLDVKTGAAVEEPFLPRLTCVDNCAEFSVTGGRNNNVIRVDGFTSLSRPVIEKLNEAGEWEVYNTSVKEFDGYSAHYILNGTYGYSFVFTQESPDDVQTFRIKA